MRYRDEGETNGSDTYYMIVQSANPMLYRLHADVSRSEAFEIIHPVQRAAVLIRTIEDETFSSVKISDFQTTTANATLISPIFQIRHRRICSTTVNWCVTRA